MPSSRARSQIPSLGKEFEKGFERLDRAVDRRCAKVLFLFVALEMGGVERIAAAQEDDEAFQVFDGDGGDAGQALFPRPASEHVKVPAVTLDGLGAASGRLPGRHEELCTCQCAVFPWDFPSLCCIMN